MVENLSEEQLSSFKDAFSIYGNTGDWTIPTKMLGTVMRALGTNPTETELVDFIAEIDPEGNGFIEFTQFLPIMVRKMKDSDTIEELIEAFKVLDKDDRGAIPSPDFRYLMVNMGEKMREEEVDDLMKDADSDNTGYVTCE
jgi:calmodulin